MDAEKPKVDCSFCGVSQEHRRTMVAGAYGAICDVCILLCVDICAECQNKSPSEWLADPNVMDDALRYNAMTADELKEHFRARPERPK